jgi:hypothetical protein
MSVLDRVTENPTICGIELAFAGALKPSDILGWQEFANSFMEGMDFAPVHFGFGSVNFGEESATSAAGIAWKQTLSIRLPITDSLRSQRLELISKARFIKVKLSNNKQIVIGRNDFNQNARPKIAVKTNHKIAEVEFTTVSIFPTGYIANETSDEINSLIPLILT